MGFEPVTLFFFQASLRNCINCVHCDDHFFIFISFPQFICDLFHISLTKKCLFSSPEKRLLNLSLWYSPETKETVRNIEVSVFGECP